MYLEFRLLSYVKRQKKRRVNEHIENWKGSVNGDVIQYRMTLYVFLSYEL